MRVTVSSPEGAVPVAALLSIVSQAVRSPEKALPRPAVKGRRDLVKSLRISVRCDLPSARLARVSDSGWTDETARLSLAYRRRDHSILLSLTVSCGALSLSHTTTSLLVHNVSGPYTTDRSTTSLSQLLSLTVEPNVHPGLFTTMSQHSSSSSSDHSSLLQQHRPNDLAPQTKSRQASISESQASKLEMHETSRLMERAGWVTGRQRE